MRCKREGSEGQRGKGKGREGQRYQKDDINDCNGKVLSGRSQFE